jgi:hypothetical protein
LEAGLEVEYARNSIGFHWPGCEEGDEVEGEVTAKLLDGTIEIKFAYQNRDEAILKAKPDPSSTSMLDDKNCILFDHNASQPSGRIGSSVDIDPIGAKVRSENWGVTVHDHFAEVFFAKQEIVTYPQKIRLPLLRERQSRSDARVNEKEVSNAKSEL